MSRKQHAFIESAAKQVQQDIDEAVETGKFMVAIFHVDGAGATQGRWTTWNFPYSCFDDALIQFEEFLRKNTQLRPRKLQLAGDFLKRKLPDFDLGLSDPLAGEHNEEQNGEENL